MVVWEVGRLSRRKELIMMVKMFYDQSRSKGLIRIAIIRTIYEYFDILLVIIMIITRL